MSVSLLVTPSPTEPAKLLPIATEAVFESRWLPTAERLSLTWMPLFQTGVPVPPALLPEVASEFEAMTVAFIAAAERELASRSRTISVELRRLTVGHPTADVYIG